MKTVLAILLLCFVSGTSIASDSDIQALAKDVMGSVKPSDSDMANWSDDLVILAMYNACRSKTNMFCGMIDESVVKAAIKRVGTTKWKESSIGVKFSVLMMISELAKDVVVKLDSISKTPDTKPVVQLKLEKWDHKWTASDISYKSGNLHISHVIQNKYDKPIKLIDGRIRFYDLLGEHITSIKLDKDVTISPNSIHTSSGTYSISKYDRNELRMKTLKHGDITAKLEISQVVLSDNTIIDFR